MKKRLLSFSLGFICSVGAFAQTFLLQEDFQSGLPGTWSQTTLATDGGWLAGTGTALSSSSFTFPAHTNIVGTNDDDCNCNKSADRLISPSLDLTGYSSLYAKFDLFFYNGAYQGAQEVGTFAYSTNGGSTWTSLQQLDGAENWQDGLLVDVSAAAGNSDVKFSWLYNDGSGWTFGMGLDNVAIFEPAAVEVELTSLSIPQYAAPGNINITGTITSYGTATLNNVSVVWSDGTNNYTDNLTGLGLSFGDSYNFTHATPLAGTAGNTYNIDVTIDATGDADGTNNDGSSSVTVALQLANRLSLVEDFTSSTCPPCQWLNESGFDGSGLNNGLSALNANNLSGAQVSVVKYPVDWPGEGDHGWNSEVENRRAYYGVTGAPTPFVDGEEYNFSAFNSSDIADHQDDIAVFDIAATHTIDGSTVTVDVTVDPYVTANAKLYIALVEVEYAATSHSSFSNGETEFHNIFRKMLPNASGSSVSLTAGTQYTAQQSYTATVNPNLPTQGSFDFHAGADFRVVAFLQASNKTVLNSTVSSGPSMFVTGIREYDDNTTIGVYPNPISSGALNVVIETENHTEGYVTVSDMKGAVVLQQSLGGLDAGMNRRSINIDGLSTGLYNVNVLTNGFIHSTRITVAK